MLTVVTKATYDLVPVQARLAQDQDDPNEDDNHWNDDPARSLYSPHDLVPFKVRADVLLVGHAFAPRGEPARSIQTRLIVGAIDKSIEAFGERTFSPDGTFREGPRVAKIPLRYERAAGGPDTFNPVGVRPDAPYDAHGQTMLPNLQPPGIVIQSRAEVIPPIGYGPIAPAWPSRAERLGRHAGSFSLHMLHDQPLPDEIAPSFFNCAPHDQQLDDLRDNERIVLENLHPQHPRLVTTLPGFHPRIFALRTGNPAQEIATRCDRLWIDAIEAVHLGLAWSTRRRSEKHPRAHRRRDGRTRTAFVLERCRTPFHGHRCGHAPARAGPSAQIHEWSFADTSRTCTASAAAQINATHDGISRIRRYRRGLVEVSFQWRGSVEQRQYFGDSSGELGPPVRPAKRSRSSACIVSSSRASGAWRCRAKVAFDDARQSTCSPATNIESARAQSHAVCAVRAAFDASATAHGIPSAPPHPRWKPILDKLKPPPRDLDFDDEPPPEEPPEVRDKRDVFAVLTKGATTDAEGMQEAIADAVADDGTFTPPLVLVSGELSFPFDELETLKATVTAVTPLIAGDKKLKETVDTVNELLKTPWVQSSSGVAEGLTQRVKEAFAQGNRMLPPSYLDSHTDRMLLEQRHYQKRTVVGELWIRRVLLPAGSQQPMPAYLPEALSKKLPMFQRFKARLIAEAHMQQDEYENHPAALKVVALGRVVGLSRRGLVR